MRFKNLFSKCVLTKRQQNLNKNYMDLEVNGYSKNVSSCISCFIFIFILICIFIFILTHLENY